MKHKMTHRAHRRASAGFTLVELLVATTMLAFLAAAGYAALTTGTSSAAKAKGYGAMVAHGQAALQTMARDIRCAVEQEKYRLMSLDTEYGGLPADTLDFIAAEAPKLPTDEEGGTAGRCEVGYYIDNDPDTEAQWLLRREDGTLDDDPLEGGAVTLAGPFVAGIDLEFYDGLYWEPGWDDQNSFPKAIRIEIVVVDENERENPMLFGTTVPIMAQ
jgi:prepilin-type N-terminal cleavage/methylation domain-containing protein